MARKRKTGKKRTLTPEHLAKMKEGRERASRRKRQIKAADETLFVKSETTKVSRMLNDVKR